MLVFSKADALLWFQRATIIYGHLGLTALVSSVFHTDGSSERDGEVLSHVESTKKRKRGKRCVTTPKYQESQVSSSLTTVLNEKEERFGS